MPVKVNFWLHDVLLNRFRCECDLHQAQHPGADFFFFFKPVFQTAVTPSTIETGVHVYTAVYINYRQMATLRICCESRAVVHHGPLQYDFSEFA